MTNRRWTLTKWLWHYFLTNPVLLHAHLWEQGERKKKLNVKFKSLMCFHSKETQYKPKEEKKWRKKKVKWKELHVGCYYGNFLASFQKI